MTLFQAFGQFANSGVTFVAGWKLMKPSSVTTSGGSATINANGQVSFTSASAVSLNDVFTSAYDNYAVSVRSKYSGATQVAGYTRLRASGVDDSGSNYSHQLILANGVSMSGALSASVSDMRIGNLTAVGNVEMYYIYGPSLAQQTPLRSTSANSQGDIVILDLASIHTSASAYDGFTYYITTDNMTGTISVFGMDD